MTPDLVRISELLTVVALGGMLLAAAIYGIVRGFKKARADGIAAERAREAEVQERIKQAVTDARDRWDTARQADEGRYDRLKEIADGWQQLSQQKTDRIVFLEAENRRLNERIGSITEDNERLHHKVDELSQLNIGLQGTVADLERRMARFEQHAKIKADGTNPNC